MTDFSVVSLEHEIVFAIKDGRSDLERGQLPDVWRRALLGLGAIFLPQMLDLPGDTRFRLGSLL